MADAVLGVYQTSKDELGKINDGRLRLMELHFLRQQTAFEAIEKLVSIRETHGTRITSIISDYVQMIQQMSVVTTLTLGMSVGLFGALIGGQFFLHPDWKNVLFAISSIVTISFSIISVLESFFLGVHLNQVEARFTAGVYPSVNVDTKRPLNKQNQYNTDNTTARTFDPIELENMNATFNWILLTFFLSFVSFAFSLLGVAYLGLGVSNSIWGEDHRQINELYTTGIFQNDTRFPGTVSSVEPAFLSLSWSVTGIVTLSYLVVLWRFFDSYAKKLYAKDLIRFMAICGCNDSSGITINSNALTPIEFSAEQFNLYQKKITERAVEYEQIQNMCRKNILSIANNFKQLRDQPAVNSETGTKMQSNPMNQTFVQKVTSWVSTVWKASVEAADDAMLDLARIAKSESSEVLITSSASIHIQGIITNLFIIDSWTGSEEAAKVTYKEYRLQPYGRIQFSLLCLWAVTGGLFISLVLCALSVLAYPIYVVFRITCGRSDKKIQNICTIVSDAFIMHYKWLYEIYLKFVDIPENKAVTVRRRRTSLDGQPISRMPVRRAGDRRRFGYSSIHLKL